MWVEKSICLYVDSIVHSHNSVSFRTFRCPQFFAVSYSKPALAYTLRAKYLSSNEKISQLPTTTQRVRHARQPPWAMTSISHLIYHQARLIYDTAS